LGEFRVSCYFLLVNVATAVVFRCCTTSAFNPDSPILCGIAIWGRAF
jgi:hypothetical protein